MAAVAAKHTVGDRHAMAPGWRSIASRGCIVAGNDQNDVANDVIREVLCVLGGGMTPARKKFRILMVALAQW